MRIAVVGLVWLAAAILRAQTPSTTYFAFTTNDVWLNLHHYLYVLGRAHSGAPDRLRSAVASAPDDERVGLTQLTDAERATWAALVDRYAKGLSQQPSMFQDPLAAMTLSLSGTGDGATFPVTTWPVVDRETLERAAPLYRKAWWPRHREMNARYIADLQRSIDKDGPAIVAFLSRAYGLEWPDRPYPTHVVAYSVWQGAFSYTGRLMILSSNTNPQNDRWYPLEAVFHEAMHQWDDRVDAVLCAAGVARGVSVPADLSHALVFYTAGEAIRRLHPEHVPMVDAFGIWGGTLSGGRGAAKRLQPIIEEIWKPWLAGRGTRNEAIAALVSAAAAATP